MTGNGAIPSPSHQSAHARGRDSLSLCLPAPCNTPRASATALDSLSDTGSLSPGGACTDTPADRPVPFPQRDIVIYTRRRHVPPTVRTRLCNTQGIPRCCTLIRRGVCCVCWALRRWVCVYFCCPRAARLVYGRVYVWHTHTKGRRGRSRRRGRARSEGEEGPGAKGSEDTPAGRRYLRARLPRSTVSLLGGRVSVCSFRPVLNIFACSGGPCGVHCALCRGLPPCLCVPRVQIWRACCLLPRALCGASSLSLPLARSYITLGVWASLPRSLARAVNNARERWGGAGRFYARGRSYAAARVCLVFRNTSLYATAYSCYARASCSQGGCACVACGSAV